MKKIAFILAITISLVRCSQDQPTYNPFDSVFDVNLDEVIEGNCDTINAGCGYINLTVSKENHKVWYQVLRGETEVLAKGFYVFADSSITLSEWPNRESEDSIEHLIFTTPFDTNKIDSELINYQLTRLNRTELQSQNIWKYSNGTDTFDLSIYESINPSTFTVTRELSCFMLKPGIQ